MDSADPRTQSASQPPQQQPHHHPQQHHTQPQRQPQQSPNDQQQQPHHIQQQLTQPQSLHQQQQTTHPPQHAQQNQPTGYAPPQHSYAHQLQLGHAYHPQQPFQRHQYPQAAYGPNLQYHFTYVQPYNHQHAWPQQPPFTATGPVPTPPAQGLASTPKTAAAPLPVREKRVLNFIHPKTREVVDLTDLEKSEKSSTDVANNPAKATTTTPTKPTATQQSKSIAKAAITTATPTTITTTTTTTTPTPTTTSTTKNSAVPVNATITNNNVTDSSSSDRTGTSSPPSVSNILLQKVSEDSSSDQRKEVASAITTATVVVTPKATTSPAAAKVVAATTKPSATLAPAPVKGVTPDAKDVSKDVEEKKVVEEQEIKHEQKEEEKEVKVTEQKSVVNNDVEQTEMVDKKVIDDKQAEACDDDSMKNDDDVNGEITLHYEKGQYNPILNKNGKKKYSREFMLEVCEKICKFDINSEVCSDSGMTAYNLEKTDSFLPTFHQPQTKFQSTNRQNDPSRRQNPNNYTGRSSAGQERQRKIIVPSSSLTNEVELKTVSNPWRPGGKEVKEEVPEDVVQVESLKKKFRSILNKLTPQNFDNLAAAVTDLHIDTEAKLGEVIDIVFAKALAEPGYCVLYGQMCSHLKKITAGQANFGNTLLKRCQNQFQADIYSGLNIEERKKKIEEEQDPEKKKHLDEELYEDMFRCRMRGLGLIKFIGELYKIEMLIDTIMFDCIQRLLIDPSSEESLECLCDLLRTIGEKLDRSSLAASKDKQRGSKNVPKTNAYQGNKSLASVVSSGPQKPPEPIATLDPIFDQLHKIRKNKDLPLSVRIRFKLLDVCELREKENWQSKSKDNNPKKLDEIKKDHLESERQKSMGPRKSQEGRRGLGHGGGSSSQISSLGNDSGSNRTNFHSSASSQSIRDHSYGDKTLQSNSDNHKMQEQHQRSTSTALGILKKFSSDHNKTSGASESPLRPSFKPCYTSTSTNATATSNTTKPAATTNSTNANAAGGGGQ